jgi:four helix bundle protein
MSKWPRPCTGRVGMNKKTLELQARTRRFATSVIRFCERLPSGIAALKIADQLIDSASSADSNYRAACRARSPKEFIAKLGVAVEEADESKGWLEMLVESQLVSDDNARDLVREANELTAIFVASRKTAERHEEEREELRKRMSTHQTRAK